MLNALCYSVICFRGGFMKGSVTELWLQVVSTTVSSRTCTEAASKETGSQVCGSWMSLVFAAGQPNQPKNDNFLHESHLSLSITSVISGFNVLADKIMLFFHGIWPFFLKPNQNIFLFMNSRFHTHRPLNDHFWVFNVLRCLEDGRY